MSVRVVPPGLGLAELRRQLEGRVLDTSRLRRFGIAPADKGKWGKANERLAGLRPNSSPQPDLEDGELKTTVRGLDGRYRESVKICMVGHSPLVKLGHIYLVIARDLNEARDLRRRVVRNEQVVSLRPGPRARRALEFDALLLEEHPKATETHYLETRTAGARGTATRAYYIRATALERYLADTVLRHELDEVREKLRGRVISDGDLRRAGVSLAQKNAVGRHVAALVGARDLYAVIRQGRVNENDHAVEDLLVCDEREDPIQALWRTIFVALTEPEGAGNRRRVREVALLAPTEVVARALRRDLRILRGSRRGTTDTYFLKLKPHGQAGSRREAFYLDRRYVERYVRLVSVGP